MHAYETLRGDEPDQPDENEQSQPQQPQQQRQRRDRAGAVQLPPPPPRYPGETRAQYERRLLVKRVSSVLHSIAWIVLACIVLYFTDLAHVLRHDTRISTVFLAQSCVSFGVSCASLLYMAVWLPWRLGAPIVDYLAHAPNAVLLTTCTGLYAYVAFTIAIWPVWHATSILIASILGMAALLSTNLLP